MHKDARGSDAFGSTRCRAERAEFYFEPFCQLAPAVNGWGFFVPNMARTQIIASSMGFFGHHPAQPVCPELCLLEFSNGTQNPAMGPLASCRASNAIAPRLPARKNIQSTEQAARLGGLSVCTPREPRFSQCSSRCFFPHLPCWLKPRRRIARRPPVQSARSLRRSVARWRSRPTRRSRRAAKMGPMHRRSGIISKIALPKAAICRSEPARTAVTRGRTAHEYRVE